MDDIQAVRELSDRDDLEAQFASTVEQAHVVDVRASAEAASPSAEGYSTALPVNDDDAIAAAAAEKAVAEAVQAGSKRAHAAVVLRTLARTVTALAMEAGGQDPRHWRPADELTADNIANLLIDRMMAPAIELPTAFRMASALEETEAATNVARAIQTARA